MNKITFKMFQDSRMKVTKKMVESEGYEIECIRDDNLAVYMYMHGLLIEHGLTNKFEVWFDRSNFSFDTLSAAEYYFWNEWADSEVNATFNLEEKRTAQLPCKIDKKTYDLMEAISDSLRNLSVHWLDNEHELMADALNDFYPDEVVSLDDLSVFMTRWFELTINKYK